MACGAFYDKVKKLSPLAFSFFFLLTDKIITICPEFIFWEIPTWPSSCIVTILCFLIFRNEPTAASGSRLFMWGCHPTEPSVVPQDGAGSESHAATESGPTAKPTPGAKPRGTPQLPVQHWPQRVASTCQHLHQQQVKPNDSPNSVWECQTASLSQLSFL